MFFSIAIFSIPFCLSLSRNFFYFFFHRTEENRKKNYEQNTKRNNFSRAKWLICVVAVVVVVDLLPILFFVHFEPILRKLCVRQSPIEWTDKNRMKFENR